MKRLHEAVKGGYLRQHWRRLGLCSGGAVIGVLIIVQLVLPWDNLPLYATIDGVSVGGKSSAAATKLLNDAYKNRSISLYFGNSPKPYRQPKPADIGLSVDTKPQVTAAMYPLWLRLIPTSLWWAHAVTSPAAPNYKHDTAKVKAYVKKELGKSCNIIAKNATLKYQDKKLQIVPAIDGGTCKLDDVQNLLAKAAPRLQDASLHVPMKQHPAKIHDAAAKKVADKLLAKTKDVSIKAGDDVVDVPQDTLLGWLDFAAPDSGIVATINPDRSQDFFAKHLSPNVTVKAGTSHITTRDFTVTSQTNGAVGQVLDVTTLITQLNAWLGGGSMPDKVPVKPVSPTPVYTRTYTQTDTGLAALLTQFAQSHSGTFGISYAELSGAHRHAGYNDTRIFETASTYKLFVAYGTLKRIDDGRWHWSDQIQGGRDLTTCFNDMIRLSDNACAEALLKKIGYSELTNEIHAIGLSRSSFMHGYIQSTPADEAAFLGMLQSGQLLSPGSTSTFITAMKGNVYRRGIPAGANGTVADKVGFLYALLHDASIVYSPSGTYILVIMTDHSSWGTIAELTRAIEQWRAAS